MTLKTLSLAAAAAFLLSGSALGADIYSTSPDPSVEAISKRMGRTFYVDVSAGPAVLGILDKNSLQGSNAIADAYWGVSGNAGLCSTTFGPDWLDLCGGVTGFTTLGSASNTIAAQAGGGRTETSLSSIGGYVQAKANFGSFTFGPFGGYRHFTGSVASISSTGTQLAKTKVNTNAAFIGLESSWKVWGDKAEIGSRAEYGRTGKTSNIPALDYGMLSAFVRVKF